MNQSKIVKKTLTSEEKLKLLEGYKKYDDPHQWTTIPVGAHIRALKKDGQFLRGGFVKSIYTSDGNTYLILENNKFDRVKNYVSFRIKLDDLKRIFVKISSLETSQASPVQTNTQLPQIENSRIQSEEIELLDKKIDLLEKIISQKDLELNSIKKRIVALENTTSGILKYLKQRR